MRIAQVAPLAESIPPKLYGGTERVVSGLTEELVRRGHDVTLFASGDSETSAKLVPCSARALRLDHTVRDSVAHAVTELGVVCAAARDFDLIHNHIDYLAFPFSRIAPVPMLSTAHGRLDLPEIRQVYESFPDVALVSISNAQRVPLPNARWLGTVPNGIDLNHFPFHPDPGDYLVFLGRIAPEKRPDRAIEIARDVGMPLVVAAKVDPVDRDYFEQAIEPLLRHPLIEYIGEVDEAEKARVLGGAYAYIFPIDWPEPFGITMVEAMATGTPVIASNCGSVPEVVVHGRTGFVCNTMRELISAVEQVAKIDRLACREHVAKNFTVAAMADGYERIYRQLLYGEEIAREAGA